LSLARRRGGAYGGAMRTGRRISTRALAAAALATLAGAAAGAAPASAASEGGSLTAACRGVDERLRGPCRGPEKLAEAAAADCRWAGGPSEACSSPFGPRVDPAALAAYPGSWTDRALSLQFDLAGDVPLRDAPWVGTHNSYNSVAEMGPTLSDQDANQQLTLLDQLALDVRSLEIDVHWFPRLASGGRAPVVCHATGQHAGCSVERPLDDVLAPIGDWLRRPENRDEVLLLYLEDHLEGAEGHAAGAAAVERELGDLLHRPPSGGSACDPLPLELSRDDVAAGGGQVVIVSGCGTGTAWQAIAFDWSARHVEARPRGFTDFPGCGSDYTRTTYDTTLVRYFEDATGVTATAATVGAASHDDGLTPETTAAMARCGVELTGFDQILPDDGRLDALVWSWAPAEPGASGDCAAARADGRWAVRACAGALPAACRAGDGSWSVSAPVEPGDAEAACAAAGAVHSAPRTGYENELLRAAAGGAEAWLALRRAGGGWTALDARG
jgi:hypothetical protein